MMGQGVKSKVPRPEVPLRNDESHYDNQLPHVWQHILHHLFDAYVSWLTFAIAQVLNFIHYVKYATLSIKKYLT